jgi:hypothetical protein
MTLADVPPADAPEAYVLFLAGRPVPREEIARTLVPEGAEVILGEVPQVFAALFPAATGLGALLVAAADVLLVAGVSYGISLGIAALTAPRRSLGFRGEEESPGRNFAGIQNTVGPGQPVMVILGGPIRVGGHIVQSFERLKTGDGATSETELHTLISLGMGPLKSISDPHVDGNPIAQTGAPGVPRRGIVGEDAIPGFHEVHAVKIHQREIRAGDGWQVYSTVRECDAFEVLFRFPLGLHRIHRKSRDLLARGGGGPGDDGAPQGVREIRLPGAVRVSRREPPRRSVRDLHPPADPRRRGAGAGHRRLQPALIGHHRQHQRCLFHR